MSAILRIRGAEFDPDAALAGSPLAGIADRVFHRGEPRFRNKRHEISGVQFVASNAEMEEFDRQIDEATAFLRTHREEIRRLAAAPGVEDATLDFGICWQDVVFQFDYLPPSLVRLAGELGLGLEISHYPCSHSSPADSSADESA